MKKFRDFGPKIKQENTIGEKLSKSQKKIITVAVRKVVKEYGEALRMLGRN